MRILHLSDIHFTKNHKNFKKYVTKPLFEDVKLFNGDTPFDLVIYTGDLVDKGGYPFGLLESLEAFENEFITELMDILNLPKEKFIFVPGNHDIERKRVNPLTEKGLKEELVNRDKIEFYMSRKETLNLERIEDYKIFENIYYSNSKSYNDNGYGYSMVVDVGTKKIGLACLNSSWRCYDENDKGNLIVGKKQFEAIDGHLSSENLDFMIAVMHHPFEFLTESEYEQTKDYIFRDFDILFTGHTHQSNAQSITTSLGNGCVICSSSSNWEKNNFQNHGLNRNGYNIINYDFLEKKVTIQFRRYNYEKDCFVENTDLGMGDTSQAIFHVGDTYTRELWSNYTSTIRFIKDHFLDVIDQNLVSYNTDTIAPKKLKDLFVLPQIKIRNNHSTENEDYVTLEKKREVLALEDLYNYKNDLVIFGQNESGKTTLLYRVALEVIEKSYLAYKIPVYIDLKTLNNITLFKKISLFIGASKKGTEEILNNYEVLLLLDNLRYIIDNDTIYQQLISLKEQYPQLRILATYDYISKDDIPREFIEHPISKHVDTAIVEYFKSNEIQNLMKRWFYGVNKEIEDENLIQIVKNFHLLNIPSTPLAVSLFLWIYEKQKGFIPRNNAAMVQNFIEKLFEKHSESDVQSSKFDFHNKDNLLGHIAVKMYYLGNPNYVIPEDELKNFIKDLNQKKKIGLTTHNGQLFHEWVINYFVEKGILLSEIKDHGRFFKFKLNCFFQYFLAKAMIFSPEFKRHVLCEEQYLTFINEIDYYSGLNRYDGEILELMLRRMEKTFTGLFKQTEIFEEILSNKKLTLPFDLMFAKSKNEIEKEKEKEGDLFIEEVKEESLNEFLDSNKQSDEEIMAQQDLMLESSNLLPEQSSVVNKIPMNQMSKYEILQNSWIIVGKILKNVEDLEDGVLKDRAYRNVIICSLVFLNLTKETAEIILRTAENNDDEQLQFYKFFVRFSLLLHQNLLFTVMGTSKLLPVIEDYLNNESESMTNVEKMVTLFMLIDSGSDNFKSIFNEAIQNNMTSAVREFTLAKLQILDSNTKEKKIEDFYRQKINQLVKQNNQGSHVIVKQKAINRHKEYFDKKEWIDNFKKIEQ